MGRSLAAGAAISIAGFALVLWGAARLLPVLTSLHGSGGFHVAVSAVVIGSLTGGTLVRRKGIRSRRAAPWSAQG